MKHGLVARHRDGSTFRCEISLSTIDTGTTVYGIITQAGGYVQIYSPKHRCWPSWARSCPPEGHRASP